MRVGRVGGVGHVGGVTGVEVGELVRRDVGLGVVAVRALQVVLDGVLGLAGDELGVVGHGDPARGRARRGQLGADHDGRVVGVVDDVAQQAQVHALRAGGVGVPAVELVAGVGRGRGALELARQGVDDVVTGRVERTAADGAGLDLVADLEAVELPDGNEDDLVGGHREGTAGGDSRADQLVALGDAVTVGVDPLAPAGQGVTLAADVAGAEQRDGLVSARAGAHGVLGAGGAGGSARGRPDGGRVARAQDEAQGLRSGLPHGGEGDVLVDDPVPRAGHAEDAQVVGGSRGVEHLVVTGAVALPGPADEVITSGGRGVGVIVSAVEHEAHGVDVLVGGQRDVLLDDHELREVVGAGHATVVGGAVARGVDDAEGLGPQGGEDGVHVDEDGVGVHRGEGHAVLVDVGPAGERPGGVGDDLDVARAARGGRIVEVLAVVDAERQGRRGDHAHGAMGVGAGHEGDGVTQARPSAHDVHVGIGHREVGAVGERLGGLDGGVGILIGHGPLEVPAVGGGDGRQHEGSAELLQGMRGGDARGLVGRGRRGHGGVGAGGGRADPHVMLVHAIVQVQFLAIDQGGDVELLAQDAGGMGEALDVLDHVVGDVDHGVLLAGTDLEQLGLLDEGAGVGGVLEEVFDVVVDGGQGAEVGLVGARGEQAVHGGHGVGLVLGQLDAVLVPAQEDVAVGGGGLDRGGRARHGVDVLVLGATGGNRDGAVGALDDAADLGVEDQADHVGLPECLEHDGVGVVVVDGDVTQLGVGRDDGPGARGVLVLPLGSLVALPHRGGDGVQVRGVPGDGLVGRGAHGRRAGVAQHVGAQVVGDREELLDEVHVEGDGAARGDLGAVGADLGGAGDGLQHVALEVGAATGAVLHLEAGHVVDAVEGAVLDVDADAHGGKTGVLLEAGGLAHQRVAVGVHVDLVVVDDVLGVLLHDGGEHEGGAVSRGRRAVEDAHGKRGAGHGLEPGLLGTASRGVLPTQQRLGAVGRGVVVVVDGVVEVDAGDVLHHGAGLGLELHVEGALAPATVDGGGGLGVVRSTVQALVDVSEARGVGDDQAGGVGGGVPVLEVEARLGERGVAAGQQAGLRPGHGLRGEGRGGGAGPAGSVVQGEGLLVPLGVQGQGGGAVAVDGDASLRDGLFEGLAGAVDAGVAEVVLGVPAGEVVALLGLAGLGAGGHHVVDDRVPGDLLARDGRGAAVGVVDDGVTAARLPDRLEGAGGGDALATQRAVADGAHHGARGRVDLGPLLETVARVGLHGRAGAGVGGHVGAVVGVEGERDALVGGGGGAVGPGAVVADLELDDVLLGLEVGVVGSRLVDTAFLAGGELLGGGVDPGGVDGSGVRGVLEPAHELVTGVGGRRGAVGGAADHLEGRALGAGRQGAHGIAARGELVEDGHGVLAEDRVQGHAVATVGGDGGQVVGAGLADARGHGEGVGVQRARAGDVTGGHGGPAHEGVTGGVRGRAVGRGLGQVHDLVGLGDDVTGGGGTRDTGDVHAVVHEVDLLGGLLPDGREGVGLVDRGGKRVAAGEHELLGRVVGAHGALGDVAGQHVDPLPAHELVAGGGMRVQAVAVTGRIEGSAVTGHVPAELELGVVGAVLGDGVGDHGAVDRAKGVGAAVGVGHGDGLAKAGHEAGVRGDLPGSAGLGAQTQDGVHGHDALGGAAGHGEGRRGGATLEELPAHEVVVVGVLGVDGRGGGQRIQVVELVVAGAAHVAVGGVVDEEHVVLHLGPDALDDDGAVGHGKGAALDLAGGEAGHGVLEDPTGEGVTGHRGRSRERHGLAEALGVGGRGVDHGGGHVSGVGDLHVELVAVEVELEHVVGGRGADGGQVGDRASRGGVEREARDVGTGHGHGLGGVVGAGRGAQLQGVAKRRGAAASGRADLGVTGTGGVLLVVLDGVGEPLGRDGQVVVTRHVQVARLGKGQGLGGGDLRTRCRTLGPLGAVGGVELVAGIGDERLEAGRDVLGRGRGVAGVGVDGARGGTHVDHGAGGVGGAVAVLDTGLGAVTVDADLDLLLLPLRVGGEGRAAGQARKRPGGAHGVAGGDGVARAVGDGLPTLEVVAGARGVGRLRDGVGGFHVVGGRRGGTAGVVVIPGDGVSVGGPVGHDGGGTREGAVGRGARPGDLEVGDGHRGAGGGDVGGGAGGGGVGPLGEVVGRALVDGDALRDGDGAAVLDGHLVGIRGLMRDDLRCRGVLVEGEDDVGGLPLGVEDLAGRHVGEGVAGDVHGAGAGTGLGPAPEVVALAPRVGDRGGGGDGGGTAVQDVVDGVDARGAVVVATVGVERQGHLVLLGPLGVDLELRGGVSCLAGGLHDLPQLVEGVDSGDLGARGGIAVLLGVPAVEGVTGLGGRTGRQADAGGPVEVALRVVGGAVAGSGLLVVPGDAVTALDGPLRVERHGGGEVVDGRAGGIGGAAAVGGGVPAGEVPAHQAGGRGGGGVGAVGHGHGRGVGHTRHRGAGRVGGPVGVVGDLRVPQGVEGHVGGGHGEHARGTGDSAVVGVLGARGVVLDRGPAGKDVAGADGRAGGNVVGGAGRGGGAAGNRAARVAIAVIGDGGIGLPHRVQRDGGIGRDVVPGDGEIARAIIGSCGGACALGPAQELVARAGRGVVGHGAGIVVAVVYGNGSGVGGHGARDAAGKVLVIGEGDVVLGDLPHGIERVGTTVGAGQGGLKGALVENLGGGCIVRSRPALEGIARAGEAAGRRTGGGAIGGCIRRRGGVGDGHGRAGATAIVIGNGEGDIFFDLHFAQIKGSPKAGVISRSATIMTKRINSITDIHIRSPSFVAFLGRRPALSNDPNQRLFCSAKCRESNCLLNLVVCALILVKGTYAISVARSNIKKVDG